MLFRSGCYALGLRNILCITGDPPKLGDYPDATAVYDVDAIGLTTVATRLNRGLDLAGNPTAPSTGFVVGVGLNPTAVDLDREIERFRWKVDAGAEYAITQPVFDPDALFRFLDRLGPLPIPVLAGIRPLQSVRNAEFLATEVPGVTVPDGVLARLSAAGDADSQRRVGNDLAVEMALAVADRVRGWQLSLPFGRVEAAVLFGLGGERRVVGLGLLGLAALGVLLDLVEPVRAERLPARVVELVRLEDRGLLLARARHRRRDARAPLQRVLLERERSGLRGRRRRRRRRRRGGRRRRRGGLARRRALIAHHHLRRGERADARRLDDRRRRRVLREREVLRRLGREGLERRTRRRFEREPLLRDHLADRHAVRRRARGRHHLTDRHPGV